MEVEPVWQIRAESDVYDNLIPRDPPGAERALRGFCGPAIGSSWVPLEVEVLPCIRSGDFPSLASHVPVFSQRALSVLAEMIRGDAEVLPLIEKSRRWYAINVFIAPGVLDSERAEVDRYEGSGRVHHIRRYAFHRHALEDHCLFKLAELPLSWPLVREPFKDLVERNRLEGLRFVRVPQ